MKTNELQNILTTPVNKPVNKVNESSNNISDKIDQFREIPNPEQEEVLQVILSFQACHEALRRETWVLMP